MADLGCQRKSISENLNGGYVENIDIKRKNMLENSEEELYKKYMAFNDVMLEQHDPMEIAAILVIQGLTFYRSFMSEEDYQRMVNSIYDRRDQVRTFE